MSRVLGGAVVREESNDGSLVTARLTTATAAGLLALLQVAVFGVVAAGRIGFELPLVRPLLAVIYLSIFPGFLLLRVIGIEPTDATDTLLYAVGLSLTVLMFYGLAVNLALRGVGYPRPIAEGPMVAAIGALTLALTGLYYVRREEPEAFTFSQKDLLSPVFPFLLLLPLLGIYGAYALNRYTENAVLLVLFAVMTGVLLLVYTGTVSRALLPLAVWMIALALLLQNSLTGSFLAWGDSPTEVRHVLRVLEDGFWSPTVTDVHVSNQYTMLRLTILHPLYHLFTDLDIVWVYKVVHPLLFSLMPVALYQGYKRFVTARAAFFSAFLFMSLFTFYVVLSRNTRTAMALFFLALLVVLLLDDRLAGVHRKLLAMLFASSVVVSHYGVSYILFFALVLAIPAFLAAERIEGFTARERLSSRASWSLASIGFVGFYVVVVCTWYIYSSPGSSSYRLVVQFGDHFVTTLIDEFTGYEQSATIRVVTGDWESSVIDAVRYYHFVLGPIIAIGILGTALRSVGLLAAHDDDRVVLENLNREFVIFAGVFLAIFGVTFLPIQRINTARTFAIALVFLAPFLVLGLLEIGRGISRVTDTSPSARPVLGIAVGILLLYFLLNSGVISAVAVGEYSPNTLVEKERITEEGHPIEQNYYYKQNPTIHQIEGTVWLRTHAASNETVYHGHWPGGMRSSPGHEHYRQIQETYVPVEGAGIPRDESAGSGYVFLGSFEHKGDVVAYSPGRFGFDYERRSDVEHHWEDKDRIYHNGEAVVRN